MAVYVDDAIWRWRDLRWCHMLADDTDELHRFAALICVHALSYQGPPKTTAPHYDITAYERRRAIAWGARPCSREEIVAVLRRARHSSAAEQPSERAEQDTRCRQPQEQAVAKG